VAHASENGPSYRSHYLPRTRAGRVAVAVFIGLFLFAQPPLVFALANRIEPWLLGMPFLYVYLLAVYVALIGVLVWARRRGL
jgi:hypothetical protein